MAYSQINTPDAHWLGNYVKRTDIFIHDASVNNIMQRDRCSYYEAMVIYFLREADQSDRDRVLNAWRQKVNRDKKNAELKALRNGAGLGGSEALRNADTEETFNRLSQNIAVARTHADDALKHFSLSAAALAELRNELGALDDDEFYTEFSKRFPDEPRTRCDALVWWGRMSDKKREEVGDIVADHCLPIDIYEALHDTFNIT